MATITRFTAKVVDDFRCPKGKDQAFKWAEKPPGLGLRATANGSKSYVFQSKYQGRTLRMTIGSPDSWNIPDAEKRAKKLQRDIDDGHDPRAVVAETIKANVAKRTADAGDVITVADVWPIYMREGKPRKKDAWKPRYVADLHKAAALGGEKKKRGSGKMKPGHLAALMPMLLSSFDAESGNDNVREWFKDEKKRGPKQAARSVAMFSGFLSWCGTKKEYRGLIDPTCARSSRLNDVLPASKPRTDALEIDQLPAWFASVEKLSTSNRCAAAYLQALLLTGARREELATLRWENVDFRWKKLTIADKVDATRTIPLTPYVAWLLSSLPHKNNFVFATEGSVSGRITEPRSPHAFVLADAGIPHVSIHGLRRSFSLLGEAAGAPAGAIAQVMGHRPSALAERYRPRSIDALRPYLATIETFILQHAHIQFDPSKTSSGALRVVK